MTKTALITGVSGQDGAYLSRLLLKKGYRVLGGVRRTASPRLTRLAELKIEREVELVEFDLFELTNMMRALERTKPDEIYNLAAQSFVAMSFEQPIYTCEIDALGVARLLEAIRAIKLNCRFYQASTSEMFGMVHDRDKPQDENTPFHPRSPYGVAKLFAHWLTVNYRESYGFFGVSGILFNHESPLRGLEFVSRKITSGLAEIKHGKRDVLMFGNLNAKRDWGFAGDYVEGMWRMLQQPEPDDYVLATGETTTVRRFVELAGANLGFDIEWSGTGVDEVGTDRKTGRKLVRIDPQLYRPAEVEHLVGSPRKAEAKLGWRRVIVLEKLVAMMSEADERRAREGSFTL